MLGIMTFSYKLQMEYTGNTRCRIWHGDTPGFITVTKGGIPVYETATNLILRRSDLEKGSHITIAEWTGSHRKDEENLSTGITVGYRRKKEHKQTF